jgi:hypothetical protein
MRQFLQGKYTVLIFSLFVLLALILLAGELKNVTFQPGQTVGRAESRTIQFAIERTIAQITDVPVWKQIVFWLTVFLIVLLISSLLSPEMRKRLILSFIRLAAFVIVFLFIIKNNPGLFEGLFNFTQAGANSNAPALENNLPPVFQPPQISSFLLYLISFGIFLLIIITFIGFYRWWSRRQAWLKSHRSLDEIADAARASLDDLASGHDWDDVIIQCYARMSQVVDARRGMHRANAMTPTEFATWLVRAGLPREPVQRLTHLFELVRYGARRSGQIEIDEATNCLRSILKYCGEAV